MKSESSVILGILGILLFVFASSVDNTFVDALPSRADTPKGRAAAKQTKPLSSLGFTRQQAPALENAASIPSRRPAPLPKGAEASKSKKKKERSIQAYFTRPAQAPAPAPAPMAPILKGANPSTANPPSALASSSGRAQRVSFDSSVEDSLLLRARADESNNVGNDEDFLRDSSGLLPSIRSAEVAELNERDDDFVRQRGLSLSHDYSSDEQRPQEGSQLSLSHDYSSDDLGESSALFHDEQRPQEGSQLSLSHDYSSDDLGESSALFHDEQRPQEGSESSALFRIGDEDSTHTVDYIPYREDNEDSEDLRRVFDPRFTNAAEVNLEDGFFETSWDGVDHGDVFIHRIFRLYTRDASDQQFAGECIRFGLIWLFFYGSKINGVAYCAERVAGILIHIMQKMKVFVVLYSRGAAASGRSWLRLRGHLMRYDYFSYLVLGVEQMFNIGRGGLILNQSGNHRWHQDNFREINDYRAIVSLLCSSKIMWFRDESTQRQFGIRVPHGALIVLSRYGAGVVGAFRHKVKGANDSFIFVFDFGEKK